MHAIMPIVYALWWPYRLSNQFVLDNKYKAQTLNALLIEVCVTKYAIGSSVEPINNCASTASNVFLLALTKGEESEREMTCMTNVDVFAVSLLKTNA